MFLCGHRLWFFFSCCLFSWGLLALALGCKSFSLVNAWGNCISEPALVGQDFSWGDQRKYPSHLERTVSWSELCPGSLAGFCFFQAVGLASGSLQPGSSESLFCTSSCLTDSAAWLVYSWRKGPRESGQLQELLKCFWVVYLPRLRRSPAGWTVSIWEERVTKHQQWPNENLCSQSQFCDGNWGIFCLCRLTWIISL